MYTCSICGVSGDEELFYSNSRVRCKDCVHHLNRERYHAKYKHDLASKRREKNCRLKNQEIKISEPERAYAAGLIDGEGSIRMTRRGSDGGKTFRVGQHTLMVEMTNTDESLIKWMQERFGGSVYYAPEDVSRNAREKWHWRVSANKALHCLDAVWPYLVSKRQQAKLGRRFQRYVQYPGSAITPKKQKLQDKFYNKFRYLNQRGIRDNRFLETD